MALNATQLLAAWLQFAEKELVREWWAITPEQDPETYTAEGVELQALMDRTKAALSAEQP